MGTCSLILGPRGGSRRAGDEGRGYGLSRETVQRTDAAGQQAWHTTFATRLARLTPREREVLDLVLAGLLNKEIALRLAISQRTVELHRSLLMQKLHAESAADLARQVLWAQGT
jgi:FixJ family two-component response regulator